MKHILFNVKNVLEEGFIGFRATSSARARGRAYLGVVVGGAVAETHSTADDRLHSLAVVSSGEPPPGGSCISQFGYNNCLENSFECIFV